MKPRKSAVKRSPKKQAPLQVVEEELEEEEEVCYFRFFLRGFKSPSPILTVLFLHYDQNGNFHISFILKPNYPCIIIRV